MNILVLLMIIFGVVAVSGTVGCIVEKYRYDGMSCLTYLFACCGYIGFIFSLIAYLFSAEVLYL